MPGTYCQIHWIRLSKGHSLIPRLQPSKVLHFYFYEYFISAPPLKSSFWAFCNLWSVINKISYSKLLMSSTYITILWVRKWNFSLRQFASIRWKIARLNIQSCEVYTVNETSLDVALLCSTETFSFMLPQKPGSAEDYFTPSFHVFSPPLSYLGAWRCGKCFPCFPSSSSLLSDLSLLPKNSQIFNFLLDYTTHCLFLVLCVTRNSGIFSLVVFLCYPLTLFLSEFPLSYSINESF